MGGGGAVVGIVDRMYGVSVDGDTDLINYDNISEIGDTVIGFDTSAPGSGGDQIDLSDLIDGTPASVEDAVDNGFLSFADSESGGTNVLVDPDGVDGDFVVALTLEGIGFVDIAGSVTELSDNIIV